MSQGPVCLGRFLFHDTHTCFVKLYAGSGIFFLDGFFFFCVWLSLLGPFLALARILISGPVLGAPCVSCILVPLLERLCVVSLRSSVGFRVVSRCLPFLHSFEWDRLFRCLCVSFILLRAGRNLSSVTTPPFILSSYKQGSRHDSVYCILNSHLSPLWLHFLR